MNIPSPDSPSANVAHQDPITAAVPALWNPVVAIILAFFFSPIIGAFINMKNWQAMGDADRAKQSLMWIYGTIAVYLVLLAMALVTPGAASLEWLFRATGICLFVAWYLSSGKEQKDIVLYRFGANFEKRGWTKLLLISIGIYVGVIAAISGILMVLMPE